MQTTVRVKKYAVRKVPIDRQHSVYRHRVQYRSLGLRLHAHVMVQELWYKLILTNLFLLSITYTTTTRNSSRWYLHQTTPWTRTRTYHRGESPLTVLLLTGGHPEERSSQLDL